MAAAMLGCRNSLSQKLKEHNPKVFAVHCYAHRLALACTDTIKELTSIQKCERALVQTWKFFSQSPSKSEMLKHFQALDGISSSRKLIKACRTRWLSHTAAVKATKSEFLSVNSTLKYYAEEKNDCTAIGILKMICTKSFIFSLNLLSCALKYLNRLCLLFQDGNFNFSHVKSTLTECIQGISNLERSGEVVKAVEEEWSNISIILPDNEKLLQGSDINKIKELTTKYCKALIDNINERFPEPETLFAFRIFDRNDIPQDSERRKAYGNADLRLLFNRFHISSECDFDKVLKDYQSLKDRLVSEEFEFCDGASEVCRKIARDKLLAQNYPELHWLSCVALTIPLSTAWPERGFSTLRRVKNQQRNRLLDSTLNALLNVSMNGPTELSAKDAEQIANKWQNVKNRRIVHEKAVAQAQLSMGEELDAGDEWFMLMDNEFESDKFFI